MGWMEMFSKANYVYHNYMLHTKHPNPSQAVTANLVLVHFPHRSCALFHNFSVGYFLSLKASQLLQLPDCYPAISNNNTDG